MAQHDGDDLCDRSAVEQAAAVAIGDVSPVELVERALARLADV